MTTIHAAKWGKMTRAGHLPAEVRMVSYKDMNGQPTKAVPIYRLIGTDAWITARAYQVADFRFQAEQKRAKEAK